MAGKTSSTRPSLQQVDNLLAAGRVGDAIRLAESICTGSPSNANAWIMLAVARMQAGRLQTAEDAFRRALRINPGHAGGMAGLGSLLTHMGRLDEAIESIKGALALQPGNVTFLVDYGNALSARGFPEKAFACFRRAISLQKDSYLAWSSVAHALHHWGRLQEAMDAFDRVLSLKPGSEPILIGQARLLGQMHRHDEAWKLLEPLVARNIPRAVMVWFDLGRKTGNHDEAAKAVRGLLETDDLLPSDRVGLLYRLGKYLEESGDFGEAFRRYTEANRGEKREFDLEYVLSAFESAQETYTKEFVAAMPRSGNASGKPVFIVGMPRSGTSLVEQILACHPDVHGAGELRDIPLASTWLSHRYSRGKHFPAYVKSIRAEHLQTLARKYLAHLDELSGTALRVTDKMPHNFVYLGLIAQMFPGARVIHCRRNPMDTCMSCFGSRFGDTGHGYAAEPGMLGRYYVGYHRLMEHWKRVLDIPVMEVAYEQLVNDQEGVSRSMVEFLGLDWDPACLDFHKSGRVALTLSNQQVAQPMYTSAIGRWKGFADQLGDLRAVLDEAGISY